MIHVKLSNILYNMMKYGEISVNRLWSTSQISKVRTMGSVLIRFAKVYKYIARLISCFSAFNLHFYVLEKYRKAFVFLP